MQDRLRNEILRRDDSKLLHGENAAELVPRRVGLLAR